MFRWTNPLAYPDELAQHVLCPLRLDCDAGLNAISMCAGAIPQPKAVLIVELAFPGSSDTQQRRPVGVHCRARCLAARPRTRIKSLGSALTGSKSVDVVPALCSSS